MNDRLRLIVIGNGMAGMRTVEELLKLSPSMYDITVLGNEPHVNYNRIMLSPVLSGEKSFDDIIIHNRSWYNDNNIRLLAGPDNLATFINRREKTVITASGDRIAYDRLLIATGSNPFLIPAPGNDLKGVISYRTINDVDYMLETAKQKRRAVVVGGGLLGLEAAYGLKKQGMDVTLVHNTNTLMNKQLDDCAGGLLQNHLEKEGIQFAMGALTSAFIGNEHREVTGIQFSDGREIGTDMVVMAVGIRPNISLAQASNITCDKGILVSNSMQTFDPSIYAVGECVQYKDELFGLVAPLYEQANVCANHLAEVGTAYYASQTLATKLKVTGVSLFSIGEFMADSSKNEIIFHDHGRAIYKKIVLKDNRVIGAILYGDTTDSGWYTALIANQTAIDDIREYLPFGPHFVPDSAATAA